MLIPDTQQIEYLVNFKGLFFFLQSKYPINNKKRGSFNYLFLK